MSWLLNLLIYKQFSHFEATCKVLNAGDQCEKLIGYMAVYRMAFTITSFFFLMSLLTLGIRTSSNWRASIHNGFWIWKFLALIAICIGVFSIPDENIGHFQIGKLLHLVSVLFKILKKTILNSMDVDGSYWWHCLHSHSALAPCLFCSQPRQYCKLQNC